MLLYNIAKVVIMLAMWKCRAEDNLTDFIWDSGKASQMGSAGSYIISGS
jgi:hypothetical protein